MKVYHNWGRWIARCDSPVCASAAQLEPAQPSFICKCRDTQLCQHGPICGQAVTVEWPDDVAGIEETLSGRRLENRHWYPHETVEGLEAENMVHGI